MVFSKMSVDKGGESDGPRVQWRDDVSKERRLVASVVSWLSLQSFTRVLIQVMCQKEGQYFEWDTYKVVIYRREKAVALYFFGL